MTRRNEAEIYIPDSEIKYIEDKLREFESELANSADEWKEMTNLVCAVRGALDPTVPLELRDDYYESS